MLGFISSIITIVAAISIQWGLNGFRISLEMGVPKTELTGIVRTPAPPLLPTFTPTAIHTATSPPTPTPTNVPTNTAEPTFAPVLTPNLVERTHIVKSGEIMACIAKLYYRSSDAQDELCAYNFGHPDSALFGKSECGSIFPGDTIVIPRSLIAMVITDKLADKKGWVILNADAIEQPSNAFLCQEKP
ncbi:MAG: hypothetical protein R2911_27905 [Caldilineaceae bacterium]